MQAGMLRAMLVVLALGGSALALDLDGAKAAGLVGEKPDGYVDVVSPSASAEAKALVADVNTKRRAAYARIAQQNGAPLADVAALAGKKLIDGAPSGSFVYVDGQWRKQP
jgi:uncharacterized protein YdbL (DUF1318 family)